MTQMSLEQLDRRLAMFDPHLPREDILASLRALPEAQKTSETCKKIAVASLVITIVMAVAATAVVSVGTQHASELLVYQKRCVTPETADSILTVSETLSATNAMCLGYHEKDRELFQAVFARADAMYQTADQKKVIYTIGGYDASNQDLPVLPEAKGRDFFLSGEEPGRWSGFLVQGVQQRQTKVAQKIGTSP